MSKFKVNTIEDFVNNKGSTTFAYQLQISKPKFLLLRMRFCLKKKQAEKRPKGQALNLAAKHLKKRSQISQIWP